MYRLNLNYSQISSNNNWFENLKWGLDKTRIVLPDNKAYSILNWYKVYMFDIENDYTHSRKYFSLKYILIKNAGDFVWVFHYNILSKFRLSLINIEYTTC